MTQPVALLVSIISESFVAWILVAALGWGDRWRAALAAAVGTVGTHWLAWGSILWLMEMLDYSIAVAGVEAVVVLIESFAYRWVAALPGRRALTVSFVANGASTGVGLAFYLLALTSCGAACIG